MNQPHFQHQSSRQNALAYQTLESVFIKGRLRDLACELTVEQLFANHADQPIEAVYTFPLPFGAVLLDLMVKIGNRELRGSVIAKKQAERRYEEAITEGDGAIMLEQSDDGVCTVNLGNLLPGERATLTYEYAYLLNWQQDTVKFRLPTTIAPRYGDPIAAGYQPHQVPVTDNLVENRFGFKLSIEGLLADALLDSPSHKIDVARKGAITVISLTEQQAFMDRDFVINMKSATPNRAAGQLAWDEIGQQHTVLASFYPQIPGKELASLCLKIVVDCSGSMAGDSILQAQAGLLRILDNLRETDSFNIVRFGGHHEACFPNCVGAERRNLRHARQIIDQLAADMGGTETGAALDFAYALRDDGRRPAAVLLITDGEIDDHRQVIRRAVKSGHRVFSVGVGAAVAEEFVRDIAERTGGACELVTPNENIAEAIYRQFRRMYQPAVTEARIEWSARPMWQTPQAIGSVFAGDTLHVFAGFSGVAEGQASLIMGLQDGSEARQTLAITPSSAPWSALPRLASAERLDQLETAELASAEKIAIDYQLLTQHTNFLILDIREADQRTQDLPTLVQVPQMLAAGWGGTGTVHSCAELSQANFSMIRRPGISGLEAFELQPLSAHSCLSAVLEPVDGGHQFRSADTSENCLAQDEISDSSILTWLLVDPLLAAPEDWRTVFIQGVLPNLNQRAQQSFQLLIASDGWSEDDVAAAMIYLLLEAIGDPVVSEKLQDSLERALQYPALIDYLRQFDIECADYMLSFMDPVALENRPQKKVLSQSQSALQLNAAWNALLAGKRRFLDGIRKRD